MPQLCSPLNASQDSSDVISRTPSILQNIQAELSGRVNVRVEHLADEFDPRRFIGVSFLEMHYQSKGSIFKGCVCGADDHSIPIQTISSYPILFLNIEASYHVITLSGMGDADTPAGGSVCMRYDLGLVELFELNH